MTSSLCPGLALGTTSPRPAHLEAGPQGPWEEGLQSLEGDPASLLEGGKDGEGVSGGDALGAAAWLDPPLGPEAPLGELAHEDPWMPPRALVRAAQRQPLSRGRESQMLPLEVPQPQPAPSAPPSETTQSLHTDAESKVLPAGVPSDLRASRFRMGWGGRGQATLPPRSAGTPPQGGSPNLKEPGSPQDCRMPGGCPVGRAGNLDRGALSKMSQGLRMSYRACWTQACLPGVETEMGRMPPHRPQGQSAGRLTLLSRGSDHPQLP